MNIHEHQEDIFRNFLFSFKRYIIYSKDEIDEKISKLNTKKYVLKTQIRQWQVA